LFDVRDEIIPLNLLTKNSGTAVARFTGMASLLEESSARGTALDEEMVFASPYSSADFALDPSRLFESVPEAMVGPVQRNRADAIVTLTVFPAATVALVQRLIEIGCRVPGDVAVIAIRDYPVFSPAITTVTLHHDKAAAPWVNFMEATIGPHSAIHRPRSTSGSAHDAPWARCCYSIP
jgi:DNA-binding LacI/PurR family transcriptional regulator